MADVQAEKDHSGLVEDQELGVAIERLIADADTDLNDDEVVTLRDNLLALFHGRSEGRRPTATVHSHEWVFDGYFWHRCATCGAVS